MLTAISKLLISLIIRRGKKPIRGGVKILPNMLSNMEGCSWNNYTQTPRSHWLLLHHFIITVIVPTNTFQILSYFNRTQSCFYSNFYILAYFNFFDNNNMKFMLINFLQSSPKIFWEIQVASFVCHERKRPTTKSLKIFAALNLLMQLREDKCFNVNFWIKPYVLHNYYIIII